MIWEINPLQFQSRTGIPGHLALTMFVIQWVTKEFQSRTGIPGHLAQENYQSYESGYTGFNPERASQAI